MQLSLLLVAIALLIWYVITAGMARAGDLEARAMLASALRATDDEQRASLDY